MAWFIIYNSTSAAYKTHQPFRNNHKNLNWLHIYIYIYILHIYIYIYTTYIYIYIYYIYIYIYIYYIYIYIYIFMQIQCFSGVYLESNLDQML